MLHRDLAIVIPVLNDAAALMQLLPAIPRDIELIVADGGSSDLLQQPLPETVTLLHCAGACRGAQLQQGVKATTRPWIWFLHADCCVSEVLLRQLAPIEDPVWGRFDVCLSSSRWGLSLVAWMMNKRSRLTGICTGDQGIFVHRSLLDAIGGVPEQPLMEDIELSRRLRRLQPPLALPGKLSTSARRWECQGVVSTIVKMWQLRLRYWLGADPVALAKRYYGRR